MGALRRSLKALFGKALTVSDFETVWVDDSSDHHTRYEARRRSGDQWKIVRQAAEARSVRGGEGGSGPGFVWVDMREVLSELSTKEMLDWMKAHEDPSAPRESASHISNVIRLAPS